MHSYLWELMLYYYIVGPPPPVSIECSLSSLMEKNFSVVLDWSPFFNTQHRVDRYNVTLTPDLSSCSSDQVSPSEDYSCSGLDLQTNYTITVSAINCGDQEGKTSTKYLLPYYGKVSMSY